MATGTGDTQSQPADTAASQSAKPHDDKPNEDKCDGRDASQGGVDAQKDAATDQAKDRSSEDGRVGVGDLNSANDGGAG